MIHLKGTAVSFIASNQLFQFIAYFEIFENKAYLRVSQTWVTKFKLQIEIQNSCV